MLLTSQDEIYISGSSLSIPSGNKTEPRVGLTDYWLLKIDSIGNIISQKVFGGNDYDHARSLMEISPNKILLGGVSQSGIGGDKTETKKRNI